MKKHFTLKLVLAVMLLIVPGILSAQDGKPRPRRGAPAPVEIWANVTKNGSSGVGMFAGDIANPIHLNALKADETLCPNGGGVIIDGKYHFIYYEMGFGSINAVAYTYDTKTWEMTGEDDVYDNGCIANDLAVDPTTNTIYGVFFDIDNNGYDFGKLTYGRFGPAKTTIAKVNSTFLAIGVSNEGVVYGIADDGYLYEIDKSTGTTTKIGSTGVTVANSQGVKEQSGDFDHHTDTFYWACKDASGESALYTVDTTTGHATKVADFANNEDVSFLYIPAPAAADGAPAKVSDLNVDFPNGSTSGTISFTAPRNTFNGDTLTANLDYFIVDGNDTLTQGTVNAGGQVSVPLTLTEGQHELKVTVKNDAGSSPQALSSIWIGEDTPLAVDSVLFTVDGNEANVSWSAAKAEHGGYMGNLKYDVVRNPGNVSVAKGTTSLSLHETLPDAELTKYSYIVTPSNGDKEGEPRVSNSQIVGTALEPPYEQDFDESNCLDLFTIIDANKDGFHWRWNEFTEDNVYTDSEAKGQDDWLITPPLHLKAGYSYHFSFDERSAGPGYPESFSVSYGTGDDYQNYETLVGDTTVENFRMSTIQRTVVPSAEGDYRFAFHCTSNTEYLMRLYIDNIKLSAPSLSTAPDSVTSLYVTPEASGALQDTIHFVAPVKTIDGSELTGSVNIKVVRDDKNLVAQLIDVEPGKRCDVVDEGMTQGTHTYTVSTSNADGDGAVAKATVFVGQDTPASPEPTITDHDSFLRISWDKVNEGLYHHFVNPDSVVYNIYAIDDGFVGDLIAGGIKDTHYDIPMNTTTGNQHVVYYAVSAQTTGGESNSAQTKKMVIGAPYELPFFDSFAGGEVSHLFYIPDYQSSLGLSTDYSADNDGGSMMWATNMFSSDNTSLCTGKIDLGSAIKPQLNFSYYCSSSLESKISVYVLKKDGSETLLKEINSDDLSGGEKWRNDSISLADYTGEDYVIIRFRLANTDPWLPDETLGIDAISIKDATTDGINTLYSNESSDGEPMYDLSGRRIYTPNKNQIVIIKGRKYIAR